MSQIFDRPICRHWIMDLRKASTHFKSSENVDQVFYSQINIYSYLNINILHIQSRLETLCKGYRPWSIRTIQKVLA